MVAQQDIVVGETKVCSKTSNMMMIKGKRTKRSRPLSPLALTMSSATTITDEGGVSSAMSEEWAPPPTTTTTSSEEEEDMAHCLILLAQGSNQNCTNTNQKGTTSSNNNSSNAITSYECKTCNKSFSSFQALGGHRASHKKPKPATLTLSEIKKSITPSSVMFSLINTDHNHNNNHHHHLEDEHTTLSLQIATPTLLTTNISTNNNNNNNNKGNKVHECGICGAEFSSGQALGGHMRRHRPIGTSATTSSATTHTIPRLATPFEDVKIAANNIIIKEENSSTTRNLLSLDLNLPAPEDEQHHHHHQHRDSTSKFVFASNEKTLVFSASTQLVDCHY